MEIKYSADAVDLDKAALDAQAERPAHPIRLRIQPTLLRLRSGDATPNHRSWSGVSWTLECPTAADAIAVREALQAFFAAVAYHGAGQIETALTATMPKG